MRLVLFIGHHKVGSTSLQTFLASNQRKLRRAGILYPWIEQPKGASGLQSVYQSMLPARFRQPAYDRLTINAREPHNALAFKMLRERRGDMSPPPFHSNIPTVACMQAVMQEQIARYRPDTTILCSEVFAKFSGKAQSLAEQLRDMFPADQVQIVCILRRIDQYIASWYSQRLKFGHRLSPLREDGLDMFLDTIHVDYRRVLKSWRAAFPGAEFSIRNYADVVSNGGTVNDFFEVCGITLPAGLESVHSTNASIPRAYFELCRQANLTLDRTEALSIRSAIISDAQSGKLPSGSDVEVIGKRNRKRLYQRFQPVHTYLNRISGRASFFPDQEQVLRLCAQDEYEAALGAKEALLARAGQLGLSGEALTFIEAFEPDIARVGE